MVWETELVEFWGVISAVAVYLPRGKREFQLREEDVVVSWRIEWAKTLSSLKGIVAIFFLNELKILIWPIALKWLSEVFCKRKVKGIGLKLSRNLEVVNCFIDVVWLIVLGCEIVRRMLEAIEPVMVEPEFLIRLLVSAWNNRAR